VPPAPDAAMIPLSPFKAAYDRLVSRHASHPTAPRLTSAVGQAVDRRWLAEIDLGRHAKAI